MTGSKEAIGLFRDRFEVTCSWRTLRAACDCPTAMSSCARYISGISMAMLGYTVQAMAMTDLEHILRLDMWWWRHLD